MQVPEFASAAFLFDEEAQEFIDDWSVCKQYNVPLAASLDEVPARKLEAFKIIETEMAAATKYKKSMNNGRT